MLVPSIRGYHRLPKAHKLSAAGIAATGVVAIAFAAVPSDAHAESNAAPSVQSVAVNQAAFGGKALSSGVPQQAQSDLPRTAAVEALQKAAQDKKKAAAEAVRSEQTRAAADMQTAKERSAAQSAAKERSTQSAAKERSGKTASRSAPRKAAPVTYSDNLDGWIKESLAILKKNGIPGTYEGIHRNIMRESSGNPRAINDWDVNAIAGIPSKGLLQVIPPTFKAFHVEGTSWDIYDPVANITAACNYAAQKYGTMDNVDSAY
ncbi:transglycosylase SLT domain-containing protein [Streptomyces sp. AC563]|uniref:transglycosylase SLT domain-containing protein n=1 Tax=Streptomyces buecherae TaxID=2763006 RepID=UPI00164D043C|nr:transglycosylase SLT domain-containing protein [Streptomyces buecherae]MBC3988846.1 transglycosylase SLT domain-containing protein [Streptomyces buecherae]